MCHLLEGKLAPAESHLIHSGGKKKLGRGLGKDRQGGTSRISYNRIRSVKLWPLPSI